MITEEAVKKALRRSYPAKGKKNYPEFIIRNSTIGHGLGLIANEDFKEDEVICVYTGNYIDSDDQSLIGSKTDFILNKNEELTIFKIGGYVNSNDSEKKDFINIIEKESKNALKKGFIDLCKENAVEWNKIWRDSDVIINGDVKSQQAIRFNIFHLNQTFNGNDPSLNIGPKGFTGEKYGGVTYWDTEAYCVPFYLGTKDSIVAKNLLNQRYKQLNNAIKNAEKIGLNN